jgi:hypothetical protein
MISKSSVLWFEPIIFLFFGIFLGSRVWAFFDRVGYAAFFVRLLVERNAIYFVFMFIMAVLCAAGIITFLRNHRHIVWWRWVYLFGGAYVLFDLLAIALGFTFWNDLLLWMFDTANPYWNVVWAAFSLIGISSFLVGSYLVFRLHSSRR